MSTFPNIYQNPLWTPPDLREWGRQFMELFTAGKRQKNSNKRSNKNSKGKVKYNSATNTTCCCGSGSGSGNPFLCGVCTTVPNNILVTFSGGIICDQQCISVDVGSTSPGPMKVSGTLDGASFCLTPYSPCRWRYFGSSPITTTCYPFNCSDCPKVDNKLEIILGWNEPFQPPEDVLVLVKTFNETPLPGCNPGVNSGSAILFDSLVGLPSGGSIPIPGCDTSFTVTNQINSWTDTGFNTYTSCQSGQFGSFGAVGFMLGGSLLATPNGC